MPELQLPSINWVIGTSIDTPRGAVTLRLTDAMVDSLLTLRSAVDSAVTDTESMRGGYAVMPAPRFEGRLWSKVDESMFFLNYTPMFMVYQDCIYYRLEYYRATLQERFLYQDITHKIAALAKKH